MCVVAAPSGRMVGEKGIITERQNARSRVSGPRELVFGVGLRMEETWPVGRAGPPAPNNAVSGSVRFAHSTEARRSWLAGTLRGRSRSCAAR